MYKRKSFNPKRKVRHDCQDDFLKELADKISYRGSPFHKRNPGDFGLTPPAEPRPHKTLCDEVNIFEKKVALNLLKQGIIKGLVSIRESNGFPRNIWAVTADGYPVEAQLDNRQKGSYHAYPLSETDPFRQEVLSRWEK